MAATETLVSVSGSVLTLLSGQLLCLYDAVGLCDVIIFLEVLFSFHVPFYLFVLVIYLLIPQCFFVKCLSA